jgi:urease accessory protein
MDTVALLNGLRFVDSFFPSGGFAYSSGLEAAVQGGVVKNSDQLVDYVDDLLRGGMARCEASAVCVASRAGATGKLAPAIAADRELDSLKLGREGRHASRQMGRQVIGASADTRSLGRQFGDHLRGMRMEGRRSGCSIPVPDRGGICVGGNASVPNRATRGTASAAWMASAD